MGIGEVLLIAALTFTLVHAVMDVYLAIRHAAHPTDSILTAVSIIALTGHVLFTGELTEWWKVLT